MVDEPDRPTQPTTIFSQRDNGTTVFDELRPDGTHTITTSAADGTTVRTIEKANPSTGFDVKITRNWDGTTIKQVDAPNGANTTTLQLADGSKQVDRTATGEDGSVWHQTTYPDGSVRISREMTDPDGTQKTVVKNPN